VAPSGALGFGGLLTLDGQQHLLLTGGGFAGLFALRGRCLAGDALLQHVHEVHHVFVPRAGLAGDGLAVALSVDEFGQPNLSRQLRRLHHVMNADRVFRYTGSAP
jgi:hypothetical protein